MHKCCSSACCYCCNNPRSHYSNCRCTEPTLPRNCMSCVLTSLRKDDEWKLYQRCLTGFYVKNAEIQFHTPLWRRAERAHAKAASMMDLKNEIWTDRVGPKKSQRIARRAEIVIEKQTLRACGGPLASKPTCMNHRTAQLLMQQKLCDKCHCDPYESLPDVPLAFYPKSACFDPYGNACSDEYAHMLANAICNDSGRRLKVRPIVNKTFLKSLNSLYANVGGGSDVPLTHSIHSRHRKHKSLEMEREFNGFFGDAANKRKTEAVHKRTFSSIAVGTGNPMDNRFIKNRNTLKPPESQQIHTRKWRFQYPTGIPLDKRGPMNVDAKAVKKYLGSKRRSRG